MDEYVTFQDNMSMLSLEKNGTILSSKQTKHLKAKFSLIKDYYKVGEIDVRYCPTDVMWADVLTKPLQGQKFRDMHAFLQNCSRSFDDDIELQTNNLAWKLLKQQVKTVASSLITGVCWRTYDQEDMLTWPTDMQGTRVRATK
jgi:hypothetical protein